LSFTISAGTLYHTYIDNVTASLCTNGNLWAADLAYIGRALYVNGVEFGEATATPTLLEVTTVGNIAHTNGIVFPSSDETPDAPADGGTIFVSETNGIDLSSPRIRLADGTTLQLARDNYDVCRNTSGSTIPEYSTVTIIAAPGAAYSGIQIASRTNLIARPVYGLALTTVTNNGYCRVIVQGEMAGLDTSSWAEGAPLWQSDTDGVLTNVIPTSGTIQRVARCKISHASNGTIDVDPDNVLAPTAILESTVTNIAEWAAAQATNGMLSVTTAWGGDAAGSTGTNITIAADSVLLNEIGNPDGDADINLSSRKFALRWTANTSDGIALELEASGATSNDILHIHQHTGNPPGLDLLHVEGDDADVVGIRIETANSTNVVGDGMAVFDKVLPTQLELPQSGTPDEDGEIVIDLSAAGAIVRFSSAHSLFSASTNVYPWTAIKSKTWSCSTPDLAYAETNRYPVMPIDDWQWPNGIAIVRAKLQTSEEVSCPAYILTMTNATDATPVTNLTLTLSSSAEVDADPAGGDGLVGTNNTIYVQPVTNDIAFMDLTIWYIIMGQ
jgi:hypothetical protein